MNRSPLLPSIRATGVNLVTATAPQSSGPSLLTLGILAAVGYAGLRIYRHFRKG